MTPPPRAARGSDSSSVKRAMSANPWVQSEGCFRPLALAVLAQAAINDVAILALKPPLSPPTPLPPRRAFGPLALAETARAATENVAILALKPPLSPQPSLAPPGEKGSSTALCGRVLEVVEFTVRRQHSNSPGTTLAWDSNDAACVRFEGWRLTVNSTTSNTRPHRAVELPFSPGGAREGWGESGGCSARIATQSMASHASSNWASALKHLCKKPQPIDQRVLFHSVNTPTCRPLDSKSPHIGLTSLVHLHPA